MQRYLQYARLEEMHMTHFDCWASRFGETVTALELAPEGKGYRPRTRFSRFFNLPELMNLFKEVADIKTADQLHLPVPEVEYHNVVAKPTEVQKGLVQELSERAAAIHSGSVDPSTDNMLKVTSDGRKLGLDQRIINPDFPDQEGSKVNLCVENILQVWKDGEADKLTQLVFCDISTPQAASKMKKAVNTNIDTSSPESAMLPMEEKAPFTVYDDIRSKLIARGVPAEQIAFIHDANTEVKKKELFGKVRSGQVRVLLGSTSKMGAGTNVQDRLVAIHDVDCPWRPGDLQQRKGRIERQGNQNEKVHVFRYVTEGTFDAYLWQTVENKQKFISQIAEQEVFRDWLKGHSPEEILNHAYEYTVREDILLSLEYHDLSDDQADALMKSPSPLADVFQDFEKLETSHMETVWDCLEGRADTLLEEQRRTLRETPVYPYPASYAHEHGELNQYRTSNEAKNEAVWHQKFLCFRPKNGD